MKLIHIELIVGKTKFSPCTVNHYAVFHKKSDGQYDSSNVSMSAGMDKTTSFTEALILSTSIPPLKNQTLFDLIESIEKTITGKIVIVPEHNDLYCVEEEIVIK